MSVINRKHKAGIQLSTTELELLFPSGYEKASENEFYEADQEKSLSSQAMHGDGNILKEKEKEVDASHSKSNITITSGVQETNEDSKGINNNNSNSSSLPWSSSSFMNQFEALKSKSFKSECTKRIDTHIYIYIYIYNF